MEQIKPRSGTMPTRKSVADASRIYHFLDTVTEFLIYFAIVFGPWAFGTTQKWSILVMNWVGYTLGIILFLKIFIRKIGAYVPLRWYCVAEYSKKRSSLSIGKILDYSLAILTVLILGYCFIAAFNARAVYRPESWSFDYRDAIMWLPHSYDATTSWFYFWMYLGLAGLFWGLRDWLITVPPGEESLVYELGSNEIAKHAMPPQRLRRLFYVLAVNGALLAVQGIIQRLEGGGKLLWLVEPVINKTADSQFGPYAYRSNAAQYFNLLWPSILGFWWACTRATRHHKRLIGLPPSKTHNILLPCVLLMAICPLISLSRGGAVIMVSLSILSIIILLLARWRIYWWAKLSAVLVVAGAIWSGIMIGWEELAPRLEMIEQSYEQREFMFNAGRQIAADNPIFGTGPGTFATVFQFYRRSFNEYWPAQLHNDWLETLITFGWIGTSLILLALAIVILRWFFAGGIYGEKNFVMLIWFALAGCIIHSRFDFPFQIHSVLALFLVLCSVLSCLSRNVEEMS
jgi:O-antigen ligase